MFDPPTTIALIAFAKVGNGGKQLSIGRIAYRVNRDLEIIERGPAHLVPELCRIEQRQTEMDRLVVIGRLEQRPARAKRAVERELDAAEPQAISVEPGGRG